MITQFKIRNFRSIAELTLDFSFGEKRAPGGYHSQERMPFMEDGASRAVPCLALFGANAAGKSNIIRAMRVLMELIREKKSDVRKFYDPNLIVTGAASTGFEVEMVKNAQRYVYSIEYGAAGIVLEQLTANGKVVFAVGKDRLNFSGLDKEEAYDADKLARIHTVECCTADALPVYPLFSVLGWDYAGLDAALSTAFRAFTGSISVFFDDFTPKMLPMAIDRLAEMNGGTREATLKKVVDVIRKLDVDILSLDIVEYDDEPFEAQALPYDVVTHAISSGKGSGISIYSQHRNDKGEEVLFRFLERESEGTKRLAVVVAIILHALEAGGAIFFDEFDRALHPLLVRELLSLFQKREHNPNGAQLCFATHCTDILDDAVLRMSEVAIISKNIRTGTIIRRLTDMKYDGVEIRNVTNFRKQYLDGFYAGIPYPAV